MHDLLGHSLTTITVKAGLARRLGAADPEGAVAQITEVEDLCRRVLADVRAAVSGYREVTLASELARGRELLRASGITADLPTATEVADPAHQELFGWAVREGLTNVIRHSQGAFMHRTGIRLLRRDRRRRSGIYCRSRERAERAARAGSRRRRWR